MPAVATYNVFTATLPGTAAILRREPAAVDASTRSLTAFWRGVAKRPHAAYCPVGVEGQGFYEGGVPDACDGCGRGAEASGMRAKGWTVRVAPGDFEGVYCLECASALRLVPWWATCSECGRASRDEAQAEKEGWRYYLDSLGELHPRCPSCTRAAVVGRSGQAADEP